MKNVDYAVVSKINVSNIKNSLSWYESKLGMTHDPRFDTSTWSQLKTDIPFLMIGLNLNSSTGSGEAVFTFVVDEIVTTRNALIESGVDVSPIENVGEGVLLAFFKDPDNNSLGLRQNPDNQPNVKGFAE